MNWIEELTYYSFVTTDRLQKNMLYLLEQAEGARQLNVIHEAIMHEGKEMIYVDKGLMG